MAPVRSSVSLYQRLTTCLLLFTRTCKLQEEKSKVTEDLLRRRELAVKTMEDTFDQQLKNELARCAIMLLSHVFWAL